MIKPGAVQEKYIVEFYRDGMWIDWAGAGRPHMFWSIESATRNLKECLDENRVDSYRFDFVRGGEKFRTRKVYLFNDVYSDEIQEINL